MSRPCYYLVGATGFPNYGDELIARGWLRYLAEHAPDADVWFDCHSPGPARILLDGVHPRARFVDTLWRLCWEAPAGDPAAPAGDAVDPWEMSAWVQRAVHEPRLAPRWTAGIDLLARADVVHVIGGGYVNALWPRHIGLLAGAAAAVRRSGGRAAMTGLGLEPAAPGSVRLLQVLADRFEVVDVRDAASAQLLGAHQCLGVDDAFLDLGGHLFDPAADAPPFMLCLQSDLVDEGRSRLAGFVLATLREWGVDPGELGVVEGLPGGDHEVYDLLRHELPGARFIPFDDVWTRGLPARPGQTWICTRFHLHLVAAAAGATGVAVTVKPGYYSTKHHSLIELGTGWELAEDFDVLPRRPIGTLDADALARSREAKRQVAAKIYEP